MLKRVTICFLLLSTLYFIVSTFVYAEVIERIVAIVNDEVILLGEFEEALQSAGKSGEGATEGEVLNEMINRILLLEQAKKFRLKNPAALHEAPVGAARSREDDNAVINEYIERRIRAFIHIPFEDIESYYRRNRELFGDKEFYDVRDEIEDYLIKKELNRRLFEHIEELRERAYIRIQLETNSATDLH